MGRAWADNLTKNAEVNLIAWVDVFPGAAAKAAEEKGFSLEYTGVDLTTAIREVNPDFVVDVSSPQGHHSVTTTALGLGIPVIGEKPMAESMAQALDMVRASEKAGKLYMVSQSRRYDPGIVAYRQVIRDRIGQLGILNADFYIGAHFGGFRDEMDSPLILDMAIHTFDEARYLSGKNAVAVYADEFNPTWSWYKGSSCATALFEMEDGIRFTYRGSWSAEGLDTSWDADWRAVGSEGSAKWEAGLDPFADIVRSTSGFRSEFNREVFPKVEVLPGIQGSLAEFLTALKTGTTPQAECHDNLHSLAMVFATIESAKRKERVTISEILAG